jgi:hypothetical protein
MTSSIPSAATDRPARTQYEKLMINNNEIILIVELCHFRLFHGCLLFVSSTVTLSLTTVRWQVRHSLVCTRYLRIFLK